jgi:hypothetical protein
MWAYCSGISPEVPHKAMTNLILIAPFPEHKFKWLVLNEKPKKCTKYKLLKKQGHVSSIRKLCQAREHDTASPIQSLIAHLCNGKSCFFYKEN